MAMTKEEVKRTSMHLLQVQNLIEAIAQEVDSHVGQPYDTIYRILAEVEQELRDARYLLVNGGGRS